MNKEKTKEQIKDYVLLMLGAPVQIVPLAEEELDLAASSSFTAFEDYTGEKLTDEFEITKEVMQYLQTTALTYAKIMLGKTSKRLLKEGKKDHARLVESYLEYLPTFMKKDTKMTETPKFPSEFPSVIGGPCPEFPPIDFSPVANKHIKGLLVIYINVGQLPPYKAEAFVERLKDKTDLTFTKQVCEVIYIPTRDRPTQVEYIAFAG